MFWCCVHTGCTIQKTHQEDVRPYCMWRKGLTRLGRFMLHVYFCRVTHNNGLRENIVAQALIRLRAFSLASLLLLTTKTSYLLNIKGFLLFFHSDHCNQWHKQYNTVRTRWTYSNITLRVFGRRLLWVEPASASVVGSVASSIPRMLVSPRTMRWVTVYVTVSRWHVPSHFHLPPRRMVWRYGAVPKNLLYSTPGHRRHRRWFCLSYHHQKSQVERVRLESSTTMNWRNWMIPFWPWMGQDVLCLPKRRCPLGSVRAV